MSRRLFGHHSIRSLRQSGDTLVEVLVSIAIIGAVIGGSYSVASHSLQQGISAEEHTEAVKLAQGQVESLKFREQNSTASVWNTIAGGNNFCLNTGVLSQQAGSLWLGQANTPSGNPAGTPATLALNSGTGSGFYNSFCVSPAPPATPKYFINITKNSAGANPGGTPTFQVAVRWNAIGGGQNQSTLYYRF